MNAVPQEHPHRPGLRALIHFGALAFAFPLTWVAAHVPAGRAWAAGGCLLLMFFNLVLLFRLFPGVRREEPDADHGVWLYPLALAVAFLFFPPYAVGAAWAVLAAGDAAAAACGSRVPRPALPWNPRKSWAGLLVFFAAAVPACAVLLWWCPCPLFLTYDAVMTLRRPEWPYVWTLSLLAAAVGGLLESLAEPFDDNLRVPLGVSLTVWLAASFLSFSTSPMPQARALQPEWFAHALVANAILVGLVWGLKFVDLPGALAGGIVGVLAYFYALPSGYVLLILFVAGGSLLSRLGRATKEARGAAEARGGRRGMANVLANLSVPALCCLAYPATGGHPAALLAYAGALSAAFADTASAEIGALSPVRPRLLTTWAPVAHGTNGAVSGLGYAGAFGACALLAGAAWGAGFWRVVAHGPEWNAPSAGFIAGAAFSAAVVLAGLTGTTVDSLLGATLEDRVAGVDKHAVNLACTLTGAGVGCGFGLLLA
jgi:uncharacterized protein (TIGR00297 family)